MQDIGLIVAAPTPTPALRRSRDLPACPKHALRLRIDLLDVGLHHDEHHDAHNAQRYADHEHSVPGAGEGSTNDWGLLIRHMLQAEVWLSRGLVTKQSEVANRSRLLELRGCSIDRTDVTCTTCDRLQAWCNPHPLRSAAAAAAMAADTAAAAAAACSAATVAAAAVAVSAAEGAATGAASASLSLKLSAAAEKFCLRFCCWC